MPLGVFLMAHEELPRGSSELTEQNKSVSQSETVSQKLLYRCCVTDNTTNRQTVQSHIHFRSLAMDRD